jgi:phosphoribosylanthranilate isomerase
MIRVKICGMTNERDALKAVEFGAWAVGFIFYKESPRYISPTKARKIISELPPFITPVGVFVNHKEGAVRDIMTFCGIQTLQLHGDESPSFCERFRRYKVIKALRLQGPVSLGELKRYPVAAFLFDTYQKDAYGGSGKTFDWQWVPSRKDLGKPVILSGGLNAGNVRQALDAVHPFAVDVCSGVESQPGVKDEQRLKEFLESCHCRE